MQSNLKILQGLIQKIRSPLSQIRNRALSTLFTKISAKIITQNDLIKVKQLPGVLYNWINQTIPANKDCLYKVLSIIHRYTLTEEGLIILIQYESIQFLEQFRKFLFTNQTNVDQHVDLIKKIIKQLLPLQNINKKQNKSGDYNSPSKNITRQELFQDKKQFQQQFEGKQIIQNAKNTPTKVKSQMYKNQKQKQKNKKQKHILHFYYINNSLPKSIDQQLYSLMIQLKHGKKPTILQTLFKIQEIVHFWGYMSFRFKHQLIQQLVTLIQGKIYSEQAIRIISMLIRQLLQIQADLGFLGQNQIEDKTKRNYHKTMKINDFSNKNKIQSVQIQFKFQIFQENPFTQQILKAFIVSKKFQTLNVQKINFIIQAIKNYPFGADFLPDFLQKIIKNKQWTQINLKKKNFQQQFFKMLNHCFQAQSKLYQKCSKYIQQLFPDQSPEILSEKIPFLSRNLHVSQLNGSYEILNKYIKIQKGIIHQNFDFNIQLHNLKNHLKNLQKGIIGLPKNPSLINLYIDCMLMLAVAVARQDPLMSFYPKIKSLIIKIAEHQYHNCRINLYQKLLITFNTSQKINYLAQSYLKSQLIRLVFTDSDFYLNLFINSLNQNQTILPFLQITKLIQSTTKQQNHKYLNKFTPFFYIFNFHNDQLNKNNSFNIRQTAKILLSRIPKKFQIINFILSIFSKSKEQRQNTYKNILGLSEKYDLLQLSLKYYNGIHKKTLKYSVSTIKNYMNIIMNHNIDNQVKKSAIDQMIQCVIRIDLSLLESDQLLLKQIVLIHTSIENYIKQYVQHQNQGNQYFFIQIIRIYSIIQRRLRLQTNYLNQSINKLQPEIYLNILIILCGLINDYQTQFLADFLGIIYIHSMNTWTSQMLFKNMNKHQKQNKLIQVHWILNIFPHQNILPIKIIEIQNIAKKQQYIVSQNVKKFNQNHQKLIDNFLKGYKLKIKSIKELINIYVDQVNENVQKNEQTIKIKRKIIQPILQRQISNIIHNINQSQNQLSFIRFFIQKISKKYYQLKIFENLQQIVPHIINQLIKPNLAIHIKKMLINILNCIGLKRTKQFQNFITEIDKQKLIILELVKNMTKLSHDQYNKIVKTTFSLQIDNVKYHPILYNLYNILIKPNNIKIFIQNTPEYTRMIVLNYLIKNIQNVLANSKLVNYSSIILYKILNQVFINIQHLNFNLFDEFNNDQITKSKKQLLKLVNSLSISSNIITFLLNQIQNINNQSSITIQTFCYLLEVLKVSYKLDNIIFKNIQNESESNLTHENKLLKMFLIKLTELLNRNSTLMQENSMKMLLTSIFNLFNSLTKMKSFYKTITQFDLVDISLNIFFQKTKKLQNSEISQNQLSQSFILLHSVSENILLRIYSDPGQFSHYLLSSSKLLQGFIILLKYITINSQQILKNNYLKNFLKQFLEILAKILQIISLNQEDYFIFKLNQLKQNQNTQFNFIQLLAKLMEFTSENFMIFFMRFLFICQSVKLNKKNIKNISKTNFNTNLNPLQIFQDDSEQQDDSSIEQKRPTTKISFKDNWIYKIVQISVQRNQISYLRTLIALSIPAKIFIIQKSAFLILLKKISHKIDDKIVYQSTVGKKRNNKKVVGSNNSVILSNSRRTILTQQNEKQDTLNEKGQNILQIIEFMKLLTALFTINIDQTNKIQTFNKIFNQCTHKHKQTIKRLFNIVDKLYTLSQNLNLSPRNQFIKPFLKLINALSESSIFTQSLSNHLSEFTSPMLEESTQFILKGLTSNQNQYDSQKMKQAIQILKSLSNHESVRSHIYKNRLIQQLNDKIIKYQQKRTEKNEYINLNTLFDIVGFYLNLSKYKDSHPKILNDKKVLQILINQVYMQKSSLLSQKIIQLLANLCAYKSNKAIFMQNREIHKTILGQLQSEQIQYKCHLLVLLYNLMYRNAPAIKLYKRKEVLDMICSINIINIQNWEEFKDINSAILQVLQCEDNIIERNDKN